ncbi:MAG TPA: hypothetical protein VEC06_19895 [Paucimonas sp.]|nr:hypothetical protein [Paucimonas sp.]
MKKLIAPAVLALLAHGSAAAAPGYYLVTVYDEEGEKIAETGLWNVNPSAASSVASPYFAFGYGVTKRWHTEVYAHFVRTERSGTRFNSLAWQNDYLLTRGQYPVDLAVHTSLRRFDDTSLGYAFEFGPALQTEFGRTQVNANLFFERSYRDRQADRMQMKYQWQVKRHWRPKLSFGLQGFGELGDWNDWAPRREQSHRIGPAISGSLPVSETHALKYEAAWFTGKVFANRAKVFVLRLKYAF